MLFPAQRAHGSNPPNPLGLAERGYSFHRLRAVPSLEEGGLGVSPVKASGLAVDWI